MARYTEEQINFVKENYGKMKAKDIAIEIGRTIEGVYRIARKYGLTQPQNIEVEINEVQHQILVSGAIGDGRFKKNGKYNYYYSYLLFMIIIIVYYNRNGLDSRCGNGASGFEAFKCVV